MFKLVIQDDEGKTTVVPLIRDEITIGRKEGNTIRLTERNVSRRHARILRNNGEVHIEDLGSYNGIRVNNARIAERVSLRVSDQVQIGDYKLYLKAEGVEQVDDARTMPIERIDDTATTDVMQAVAPNGTTPMAVPPMPTPAPAGTVPGAPAPAANPQLVGSPNRTLVAIADTDPQGRPIASAAAVAALTQPVGYGKLVVLSSNFAGKEFELSRPQMIIGRTDENDIVINHRSISRNHAKLVRETETGRYTISDLQSSNGVRVNGQDYGKVELRRGDVIDLGHVRLRFIEPGEDFVFARDAVITDVPEAGGRKGLLVAILIGVLALGGGLTFFLTRDSGGSGDPKKGSITNPVVGPGSDRVALTDPPADAAEASDPVGEPPADAAGGGDTTTMVQEPDAKRLALECKEYQNSEKWDDLDACARRLGQIDAAAGKALVDLAFQELKADVANRKLDDAIKNGELKAARAELEKIADIDKRLKGGSVYTQRARDRYSEAERDFVEKQVPALQRTLTADKRCNAYDAALRRIEAGQGKSAAAKLRAEVKCTPEVTVTVRDPNTQRDPTPKDPPPPAGCNAEELKAKGTQLFQSASYLQAARVFEEAYKCKPEPSSLARAFLAACRGKSLAIAKRLYNKNLAGQVQACLESGIDPR